jgi:outer membrane lipoprotein SlyB
MHEVKAGERHLRRAVATQSAKYPIAAAAVGGVVAGGPVGIAAGSAIAGIAAAVGGAFAGKFAKWKIPI